MTTETIKIIETIEQLQEAVELELDSLVVRPGVLQDLLANQKAAKGAKARVVAEGRGDFVAGSGGERVYLWLEQHPEGGLRKEIAEACGVTVGRVAEVIKATEGLYTNEGPVWMRKPLAALLGAEEPASGTRSSRCEHEKAKKARTGSCKTCPPFVAA